MIHPLLSERRSRRAIDPDRAVPEGTVDRLLEAARWAPSSSNEQPWRFVVADARVPELLAAFRTSLAPGNAWALRAPLLILVLAVRRIEKTGGPNESALHDAGMATQNLLLQASHEGLVQHPMGGFDKTAVALRLELGEELTPTSLIALGWPGDPALLPDHQRQREDAPRARKPVELVAGVGVVPGRG